MTNQTLFLDRLITDGNYKSVSVLYDSESVKNSNFFPELADRAFGKYTIVIEEYCDRLPEESVPIHRFSDSLQLMLLTDDEGIGGINATLWEFAYRSYLFNSQENLVVLIPMISEERKEMFWNLLMQKYLGINCSIVFYQTERTMQMANTSKKPIQVYVINAIYEEIDRNFVEIDVDDIGVNDRANLHDLIFGAISKKRILFIPTKAAHSGSSFKTAMGPGNQTLVNLGSADYYLSNFIARNDRAANVSIVQRLQFQEYNIFKRAQILSCDAANGTIYAELYNEIPNRRQHERFVPISFFHRSSQSLRRSVCFYSFQQLHKFGLLFASN